MTERIDTVIVGGGQAGLVMSFYLKQLGREHVILERARIAERWRSERWDSLTFQFPNWSVQLPAYTYKTDDPDGFAPKDAIIRFLGEYATLIEAPVRSGVQVLALRQKPGSDQLLVETRQEGFEAENVVVATGPYHVPLIPPISALIPAEIFQCHSRDYRNPQQLPPGAVLIVGSGASGAQIAEELHQAGRKVYLSVGRHLKTPRRYLGRDIYWWFEALGIWHRPLELQPEFKTARLLVTGAGGGHDIDLRRFVADGVTLLGRLRAFSQGKLLFEDDLEQSLEQAEAWFPSFKARMDEHAQQNGMTMPKESVHEEPAPMRRAWSYPPNELDLTGCRITSVIWCTGFGYDFAWVKLPVVNDAGVPLHHRGVTHCPGLYFLGLRRAHSLSSSLLAGIAKDAAFLAEHIAARMPARGVHPRLSDTRTGGTA